MAYHQLYFGNSFPNSITAYIYDNDAVILFLKANTYKPQYNDGLLAYFRDVYNITTSSLPDLMARYIRDYGKILLPIDSSGLLYTENSRNLITEDGVFLEQE